MKVTTSGETASELDTSAVKDLIKEKLLIPENSLEVVEAGKVSKTFFFSDGGTRKVLRLTNEPDSYQRDVYAYILFRNTNVPVPRILDIGELSEGVHYAISEYVRGKSSDLLPQSEIITIIPQIWNIMAEIFRIPINNTVGFGHIDTTTRDGNLSTWKDYFNDYSSKESVEKLKKKAKKIGLDPTLIDKFRGQMQSNVPFLPEERKLWHGDFAFDNLLVNDGRVVAVIDWAQMGYGDWYYDFATMDFWWPNRHGSAYEFAEKYGFNHKNLAQRKAVYWAKRFLGTVEFAANKQNKETIKWLAKYAEDKLL